MGKSSANSAGGTEGLTEALINSGENPTVQAGSQKPQNPVPGAYSSSVPNRNRCEPFCHVNVSVNVKRRRSRPCVAFEVLPTVTFVPLIFNCGKLSPMTSLADSAVREEVPILPVRQIEAEIIYQSRTQD